MKAKEKKKKINPIKYSNDILYVTVLSLAAGILLGYILYRKTYNNILYLIYPPLCVFSSWMLISDQVKEVIWEEKKAKTKEEYLEFFENFFYFSSFENSYSEGFKKSFENLKPSQLKDRIQDYLDNPSSETPLPFEPSILKRQDEIIEQVTRLYESGEDFRLKDCENLIYLLKVARKG